MSSISTTSSTDIGSLLQRQQAYAQKNNSGLQDRSTVTERSAIIEKTRQTITENHGFDARHAVQNALTHNTKIINTPAAQRGGLVDISV